MSIASTLQDTKARLDSLLSYANETTGQSDVSIGDAIKTLADGFGGGGGSFSDFANIPRGTDRLPMAYIFNKCVETTHKGDFTLGVDTQAKQQMFDTGLGAGLNGFVIFATEGVDGTTETTRWYNCTWFDVSTDLILGFSDASSISAQLNNSAKQEDGRYKLGFAYITISNGIVSLENQYNGRQWSQFPSGIKFMWYAW